jgi:plasmid stabilization system protein ParE
MAYRVEVTEIAAAEIDSAYLWLRQRSPGAAERWYRGLMASLATLRENPRRCVRVLGSSSGGTEIRQLIYGRRHGRYRIVFTISDDTVEVLRVRHGARAPTHD